MEKQDVLDMLDKMNIQYELVEHEPAYTVDDMIKYGLLEKGIIAKNLFLRDKKGKRHILLTADEETEIDLKSLSKKLGVSGGLSFASEERLMKYLGLKPGSVTPLSLVNDKNHDVEFFIDKSLSKTKKKIGVHPLVNTATVFMTYKDLDKFLFNIDVDVIKF
ncbi:MAG: prolyl-tRNA synthetase associated domain-containing protein [Lachnospiraceae bacterium]|jgi:Ala-tRNA(Pro) deacylase|nr:prolyl-tRNA synthetase associated domain-containing protein [Lachnospiraceae bacterium]